MSPLPVKENFVDLKNSNMFMLIWLASESVAWSLFYAFEVSGYVTTYIIRIPRWGIRTVVAMEALCGRLNCCLIKWACFGDSPASGKSDRLRCSVTTYVSYKSDECLKSDMLIKWIDLCNFLRSKCLPLWNSIVCWKYLILNFKFIEIRNSN
jgi:hypothetical protein